MKNEEITLEWQQRLCRDVVGSVKANKIHNMVRLAIDGYLAHFNLYERDVVLHNLWQSGVYFCKDNNFVERSDNEDSRVEIMEYLMKCYPRSRSIY